MVDLVLIHPPVSLPSEPPLGAATLAAILRRRGLDVRIVDASIEALDHLCAGTPPTAARTPAARRALRLRRRALEQLRSPQGYENRDRHHAAVGTLRRVLGLWGGPDVGAYHDPDLSPLRSADLLEAARRHRSSPFAGYFAGLCRDVAELGPRVVGLSVNYLDQALPGLALAGALRESLGPGVPLVAGGGLIGCWRGRLAPHGLAPALDLLVSDEGDAALLELLGEPPGGGHDPILPDYEGVPWERYLAPERVVPLSTSRGCYWSRCRFCPEAGLGHSPRFTDPARAVREVCEASAARTAHITDSAIPPATLRRLSGLEPGRLRWYGFARFHEALADDAFCRDLRRSGCVMLQLGLESASVRVLERMGKGIEPRLASRALRALHQAGIASFVYVMFGTPGEQRDDAQQTLRFVVDHADVIGFLNVSLLNLPVGAGDGMETRELPGGGDLSLYLGFADGWQRREARRFAERELARHPAVAPILRRTPHVLGANHAAFFAERAL